MLDQYTPTNNGTHAVFWGGWLTERSTSKAVQGTWSSHKGVAEWIAPGAATAKCQDGSFSESETRQGTCSGHGGVAAWIATARCTDGTLSKAKARRLLRTRRGGLGVQAPSGNARTVLISDRLSNLAVFYHREAKRCATGKAFLAACVMQGAASEALLQGMCFLYPREVKRTTVYSKKRFRTKRNMALEFNYYELINIAAELSWFPPRVFTWGKRTTLAGFVHELRKLRNYVHPGKWAPEHPEIMKFSKGVYGVVYEIFDATNSVLLHKVERSLRESTHK